MATDNKDAMSKLQTACLVLSRLLAKEGRDFILKIKIGNQFSFCVESGIRNPAEKSTKNENRKKRKKSPSGMERDRRRRVEFLKRKGILPSAATSDADSGRMVKLDTVSHSAQEEGETTGKISDGGDAQNLPGVTEGGLIAKEGNRGTELDEIWTKVMKLQASTTETHLRAKRNLRLLGIAEVKSELRNEIDQNLAKVNACLGEFKDDSGKD